MSRSEVYWPAQTPSTVGAGFSFAYEPAVRPGDKRVIRQMTHALDACGPRTEVAFNWSPSVDDVSPDEGRRLRLLWRVEEDSRRGQFDQPPLE